MALEHSRENASRENIRQKASGTGTLADPFIPSVIVDSVTASALPTNAAQESSGNLDAINSSTTGLLITPATVFAGKKGVLGLGSVTTADPAYTTAQTHALSLTTGGRLRIDSNLSQVGGTAIDTNSGNKSAGTPRVVLATDQPAMTNAQPSNLTKVGGAALALGQAAMAASLPVVIASDQTNFSVNTKSTWIEDPTDSVIIAGISVYAGSTIAVKAMTNTSPAYLRFQNVAATIGQQVTIADIIATVQGTTIPAALPTGITLLLFSEPPSTAVGTAAANNTSIAFTAADMAKLVCSCALGTMQMGGTTVLYRFSSQSAKAIPTNGNGGNGLDLYGVLVTTSTYTSVAAEQWTFKFRVIRT